MTYNAYTADTGRPRRAVAEDRLALVEEAMRILEEIFGPEEADALDAMARLRGLARREANTPNTARKAASVTPDDPVSGELEKLLPRFTRASLRELEALFTECRCRGSVTRSAALRLGSLLTREGCATEAREWGPGGDCWLLLSGPRLLLLNGFGCWPILEDEGFAAGTLRLGRPRWEARDHLVRVPLPDARQGKLRTLLCWYGSPEAPLTGEGEPQPLRWEEFDPEYRAVEKLLEVFR